MTRKNERPLHLDMDFGEALRRFTQTDPKEVEELQRIAKQAKVAEEPQPPDDPASPKRTTRRKD